MDTTPTKPRILLIEDEKPMIRAIELKLLHAGFDTVIASDGIEGISLIQKEKFSLILLDLVMPKADGFQVLEFLKKNNITTPTIVLTNLNQQDDEERARELGASEFLVKSNTPILKVVEYIEEIVRKNQDI